MTESRLYIHKHIYRSVYSEGNQKQVGSQRQLFLTMSLDARRKNQLIDQFVDFTQSNSSVAKNFLLLARWDLEVAINEYLAYQQPPNASRKDKKSILAIFDEYKDEEDKIGIDGTLRFIEDLGYEPEDRAVLALAEFLESPSVGVFPRKNFLSKWQSVK